MGKTGYIHSFQSMGTVDGPGIRYVIFMQGCPLRCAYCHNPDTWEFKQGQQFQAEAVVKQIKNYLPYLKNGGVTVSGGEPLMQSEFVTELFRMLRKDGIHTALDTSGVGDLSQAEELLKYTDLVLADVKFLSQADYAAYCKADFSRIVSFLKMTRRKEIPLWARRVVVPDLNDKEEDVHALMKFLEDYPNVERIELLPFRKLCLEKYEQLGIDFLFKNRPEMKETDMERLRKLMR